MDSKLFGLVASYLSFEHCDGVLGWYLNCKKNSHFKVGVGIEVVMSFVVFA